MIRMLLLVAAAAAALAPAAGTAAEPAPANPNAGVKSVRLKITGMHCDGCAGRLTRSLGKVPGVKTVKVDAAKGLGIVSYDPEGCRPADLVAAVKKGGFSASVAKG